MGISHLRHRQMLHACKYLSSLPANCLFSCILVVHGSNSTALYYYLTGEDPGGEARCKPFSSPIRNSNLKLPAAPRISYHAPSLFSINEFHYTLLPGRYSRCVFFTRSSYYSFCTFPMRSRNTSHRLPREISRHPFLPTGCYF